MIEDLQVWLYNYFLIYTKQVPFDQKNSYTYSHMQM